MSVAAALPDLGSPAIVAFGGAFGAFVGAAIATARRLPPVRTRQVIEHSAFVLTGLSLLAYTFGLISGLY